MNAAVSFLILGFAFLVFVSLPDIISFVRVAVVQLRADVRSVQVADAKRRHPAGSKL